MMQPFHVQIAESRVEEFFSATLNGLELREHVKQWLTEQVGPQYNNGWHSMMLFSEPAWYAAHRWDSNAFFVFNRADRAAMFKLTWL